MCTGAYRICLVLALLLIPRLTFGNVINSPFCKLARIMFHTSIKNPLEAETVGQRRERKAKESEGSIRSSRSSFSTRLETKSVKSNKFKVFEAFSKAPKTYVATRDDHLESNVRQPGHVSRSELPASPGPLPPASESSALWPYSQGYCELSTSLSVSKRKSIAQCLRLYVFHTDEIISQKTPILTAA